MEEDFDWGDEPLLAWGRSKNGRAARDEGIALVQSHTPEEFRASVQAAVRKLAGAGKEFTAEDVRELTGDPPNHPNAMGANIFACVRLGIIRKVGYTQAKRTKSHACLLQLYQGP
jgi:hypothetical protein